MNVFFKGQLIERIKRTSTIESFSFVTDRKISFIPGQFLQVVFDSAQPGNKDLNKYLSFSSAPAREYIQVTKRLSDSLFSQELKELQKNDEVFFKGPMGQCVFRAEYRKTAFLIGGIGITPVISIIDHLAEEKNRNADIVLVYSNRTVSETAFKDELNSWQKNLPAMKIVYTVTDEPADDPLYVQGRIDTDLLSVAVPDISQREVFTYGPPKMVEAMKSLAVKMGCLSPQIHSEVFAGY